MRRTRNRMHCSVTTFTVPLKPFTVYRLFWLLESRSFAKSLRRLTKLNSSLEGCWLIKGPLLDNRVDAKLHLLFSLRFDTSSRCKNLFRTATFSPGILANFLSIGICLPCYENSSRWDNSSLFELLMIFEVNPFTDVADFAKLAFWAMPVPSNQVWVDLVDGPIVASFESLGILI